MDVSRKIAYFSMEIALEEGMPTYSGGLGILAGDMIRSAAVLHVPMVGMTLLHRKGYCFQKLDDTGWQTEEVVDWQLEDFLLERPERVQVLIEGRTVHLRAWEYKVPSNHGFMVPVYFLDSDLPENSDFDRTLTHYLYGGDAHYRLCQEVILGIGSIRMLRAMGYDQINRFHMNEGHASLLTLELLDEAAEKRDGGMITEKDIETVRNLCVFTTHTPVEAGHDKFSMDLVHRVLDRPEMMEFADVFLCDGLLNMTFLALNLSHYVNGVAKKHAATSRLMFSSHSIDSITNGVNAVMWTAPAFQDLFHKHIPGWAEDNFSLRYALEIPKKEIWKAHEKVKEELLKYVFAKTGLKMDLDCLTIGFARRAATYKRADLLLSDVDRLEEIVSRSGGLQVIYAGKAHPQDIPGKKLIQKIFSAKEMLKDTLKIAYLENYDIEMARLMTAGADLWLNTPLAPMEASGTSGMKSALNGVPSLSILDGWWVEGCIEGITGWAIDGPDEGSDHDSAQALFDKLERVIMPMYYGDQAAFQSIMAYCIALNGSFFNTQRMVQQYVLNAYFR